MKVRNNQKNPYILCGVLIPPGGVANVDDKGYEQMMQVPAFRQVVDSKLIEEVGVQAVSPGFTPSATPSTDKTDKTK